MSIIIRTFEMSLKGGDLPKDFEATIRVKISFNPETDIEAMADCCAGGMSARVKLQSQLRKWSVQELRKLELNGLEISFSEINAGGKSQKSYSDQLRSLGRELAVKRLMADLGCDQEMAEKYCDKLEIR